MRSRIRRRARALREPFGTAGLLVAIVALVFAMTGGAFAAKYIITSTKQIKPNVLKQLKGKTGPAGPQGPAGTNGTNGTNGEKGANGTNGTNGKSVTVTPIPVEEEECNELGGALVEEEEEPLSATEVCNGEEGSPWTDGGTLPSEATETGSWALTKQAGSKNYLPVSFPIPLAGPLDGSHVKLIGQGFSAEGGVTSGSTGVSGFFAYTGACAVGQTVYDLQSPSKIPAGTTIVSCAPVTLSAAATGTGEAALVGFPPAPAGCTAGTAASPKADPGFLCVYTAQASATMTIASAFQSGWPENMLELQGVPGASPTGAVLIASGGTAGSSSAWGTWAVTAP